MCTVYELAILVPVTGCKAHEYAKYIGFDRNEIPFSFTIYRQTERQTDRDRGGEGGRGKQTTYSIFPALPLSPRSLSLSLVLSTKFLNHTFLINADVADDVIVLLSR